LGKHTTILAQKGELLMSKRNIIMGVVGLAALAIVAIGLLAVAPALAKEPEKKSSADVFWTFDDAGYPNPAGTSTLIRTKNGINANYTTSGLTAGHTATAWFIVFNNPDLCSLPGCGVNDLGDTPAQGDFLLVSGHVIDSDGEATFSGRLSVGDTSGSGLYEVACPETKDCGIGLIYPDTALVVLALHSHGPAMEGQDLKAQISSFTGGCDPDKFQGEGPDNFAGSSSDIPDAPGECSTMQVSVHAAP
jgi:hypothetical protein